MRGGFFWDAPIDNSFVPQVSFFNTQSCGNMRKQIEMQTQNTQELRKLLEGKEEAMTLSALVGRYGKFFPFKAMIMKGFYNNHAEIVAGEIYNLFSEGPLHGVQLHHMTVT